MYITLSSMYVQSFVLPSARAGFRASNRSSASCMRVEDSEVSSFGGGGYMVESAIYLESSMGYD